MDTIPVRRSPAPALGAIDLCDAILHDKRLILASNRGPMEFVYDDQGALKARRGVGGVTSALGNVGRYCKATWVAGTITEGDREAVQTLGASFASLDPSQDLRARFVALEPRCQHRHYNVFSNPLLWFLHHELEGGFPLGDAAIRDAWDNGYVPANRDFATAIAKEVKKPDGSSVVMLHDYQLYLTASYLRRKVPHVLLQHFVHIPWPASHRWRRLRRTMPKAICRGLLANDIVGFQTARSVENFLATVEDYVDGARVDHRRRSVHFAGRTTFVRSYPISVDVAQLRRLAGSSEVQSYVDHLRPLRAQHTIVRVDRLDPSKNVARGFQSYERLLRQHPELREKVKFLSFLVPSRTQVREYRGHANEVFNTVEEINRCYGSSTWKPIEVFFEHNYAQALAGLYLYDVLLVNPVADGMNLVSKEGPILNSQNGVLVLSEQAGSAHQLRGGALTVDAFDVDATARALYRACTMAPEERLAHLRTLRQSIEEEDLERWFYRQLKDLWLLKQMRGQKSASVRALDVEAVEARSA